MPQVPDAGTIVLETKLYCCKQCHAKVIKAISGEPGVRSLNVDVTSGKVTLIAPDVDPHKLFQRLQKSSRKRITGLLHPTKKEPKEVPKEVTVDLKINLDCHSCIEKVKSAALQLKDVSGVTVVDNQKLSIRGWDLDPQNVCEKISKKSRKRAEVLPPKKDAQKPTGEVAAEKGAKEQQEIHKIVTEYLYSYPPHYYAPENREYVYSYAPRYHSDEKPDYMYSYPPHQYVSNEDQEMCAIM